MLSPVSSGPTSADGSASKLGSQLERLHDVFRRHELWFVAAFAAVIFLPGLAATTLIDPWETHYGEVARRMLADGDWVQLKWQNENFDSKPVLTFWLMAAGLQFFGIASDGGYSGELAMHSLTGLAIRIPFVLCAIAGLLAMFAVMRQQVNRRAAWFFVVILVTTPFFFFVARQGITDMPLVASLMVSIACVALIVARDDGPLLPIWRSLNSSHIFFVFLLLSGGLQAVYYIIYFYKQPTVAAGLRLSPYAAVSAPLAIVVISVAAFLMPRFRSPERRKKAFAAFIAVVAVTGGAGIYLSRYAKIVPGVFIFSAFALGVAVFLAVFAWRRPIRRQRSVYMMWLFAMLGIGILGKGPPAAAIVVFTAFFYIVLARRWDLLKQAATWADIARGLVVMLAIALPWHIAIFLKQGPHWVNVYLRTHIMGRAFSGVHGDRGTFDYYIEQIGIGTWPWVLLLPGAALLAFNARLDRSSASAFRVLAATWAIVGFALFAAVQTKFHHYILPITPALAILIAFFADDLVAGRIRSSRLVLLAGTLAVALICRDFVYEHKQLIELFIYRHDRPWPSGEPWSLDLSAPFIGFGVLFAALGLIAFAIGFRPAVFAAAGASAIAFALWCTLGYMGVASHHWGQRDLHRHYYRERTIYGVETQYSSLRDLADEWSNSRRKTVRSVIPRSLEVGHPTTITIRVPGAGIPNDRLELEGQVSTIETDSFTIDISDREHAKLGDLIARGQGAAASKRRPVSQIDADRMIAWQLNWRGENFWSGGEIWGPFPETQTVFMKTDNAEFLAYLGDTAEKGRRYFVVTEAKRAKNLKSILPTSTAKDSFEILDTSSNKFTLASFTL